MMHLLKEIKLCFENEIEETKLKISGNFWSHHSQEIKFTY
jgi:hypothetical protein